MQGYAASRGAQLLFVCAPNKNTIYPEYMPGQYRKTEQVSDLDRLEQAGCTVLRIDTNERNIAARHLYASLGYREADIVPCDFNRIPKIHLVLLEKKL